MVSPNILARMTIQEGDITHLRVDAIVNAANERLTIGAGVCGAIHRVAGPRLAEYCAKLGGCVTGDAKITPGFDLPAKHVIHAVGPMYRGDRGDAKLLAACYRKSFELAVQHGLKSIAFPAISTGIYGYPFEDATQIAFRTAAECLRDFPEIEQVIFMFLGRRDYQAAKHVFEQTMEKK